MTTLLLCAWASGSAAQLSGTLSAVSDYRYRGVTYSDKGPAGQAGLAYDDPHGWFAGVFGSTIQLQPPGSSSSYLQGIAYGGYAKRLPGGINVEAGANYSAFANASDLNYGEIFVGASTDTLNARVYYSPRYYGASESWYAEVGAVLPIVDRVRLHLHAGLLRYQYPSWYGMGQSYESTSQVIDGRIGLRIDLDPFQLEVAWVGISNHVASYLVTGTRSPNTVIAAVSLSF